MLLMYRKKNVGERTPRGTPRIFTLLLVSIQFYSCWSVMRSICTFFEKHHPKVSSAGGLLSRLSNAFVTSKETGAFFFFAWKAFSVSLAMRDSWCSVFLCFRYPACVGDSIFDVPEMISIFCWHLAQKVLPRQLRRRWGNNCLRVSCLCLSYGLERLCFFPMKQELHQSSTVCWRAIEGGGWQQVQSVWSCQ